MFLTNRTILIFSYNYTIAFLIKLNRHIYVHTLNLHYIHQCIENQLIESLSKGKNALFKDSDLDKDNDDDMLKMVQVVTEEFSELVDGWSDAQKKSNTEKAFKFVQKYRS